MIKKKRVFDLVFCFNDKEILKSRYRYMHNFVDYFIFIKFDDDTNNLNDKVMVIDYYDDYRSFNESNFKELINSLDSIFSFDLEDIFFISKSFEIPNLDSISDCIKQLNYTPIICEQTQLMWDHKNISKTKTLGTQIFSYSQYLYIKNIFEYMQNSLLHINHNDKLCESGWNISTFSDLDSFIKNTMFWNNLGVSEYEIIDSYFTGYDFRNNKIIYDNNIDVPIVFQSLIQKPEQRDGLKVVISDDISNLEFGDYKILITDVQQNIDNIICYRIVYPPKVLYGEKSYVDFKLDYKKNEILRIFQTLKLIDEDEIHIKINSERSGSEFICKFSEIKNGTPSLMF